MPQKDEKISASQAIRQQLETDGIRYFACDNISEYINDNLRQQLIDEAAEKFQGVLEALVIDTKNDPNSHDTARRMAKMYINELFEGRYTPEPDVTAFPNHDIQTRYSGMLITRADIKSMCSHHHQPVNGSVWIGLLPSTKVIGLSKYARLAQWYARRGQLQEEMTKQIAEAIIEHTGSKDVGVVITASHGCCENRGVMLKDSTTWTSILEGQFYNPSVKQEFYSLISGNMSGFKCV